MTTVNTYYVLNVIVPAVLSVVLGVVTFLIVLIAFPLMKKPRRIFIELLELSVPNIVVDDDNNVEIDATRLHKTSIFPMALVIISLTVSTMYMSFWNVFLIEEEVRGECVPNFDCFPMHNGDYIQHTPVDNCSQFFNLENSNDSMLADLGNFTTNDTDIVDLAGEVTYECYRFVFRYAEGIGAAGGVLFFTAIFSKINFAILVTLLNEDNWGCLRIVLTICFWVFAAILWIAFVVLNSAWPIVREAVFQTHTDIIQFVLYAINFLAIIISGYILSADLIFSQM